MNANDNLFTRLGIRYLDHLAVTTPELETTLAHYLALPGARLLRGPAENPAQRVRYAFVDLPGESTIEILSPSEDSPINHHLARGGGAYHLCYAVDDLDRAVAEAIELGAKIVTKATADPAFDGRRVAFLRHRTHGLFELVDAHPRVTEASASTTAKAPASPSNHDHPSQRLEEILRRLFPTAVSTGVEGATFDRTEGWDSAGQLVLMMEIEEAFGIEISTERITEATDYPKLVALIEELMG